MDYDISGKEIPLCVRIMEVVDIFDALTAKRCYKNNMSLEKAYMIIREIERTVHRLFFHSFQKRGYLELFQNNAYQT